MAELLNDNVKGQVKEALAQMQHPVQCSFLIPKRIVISAMTPANWLRKFAHFRTSLV